MKEKKKKIKEEIFEQENILKKEFLIYIIKNPELFEEIKNEIVILDEMKEKKEKN